MKTFEHAAGSGASQKAQPPEQGAKKRPNTGGTGRTHGERYFLPAVIIVCFVFILLAFRFGGLMNMAAETKSSVRMGVILNGDESVPYSANFLRALDSVKEKYGDALTLEIRKNIRAEDAEEVLDELAGTDGCDLILANSYEYEKTVKAAAEEHPGTEFCQATGDNADSHPVLSNYHTFMGRICEGRYIAGQVAGRKLQEMIDEGQISGEEALAGYVAAYQNPEVISGFTAFFLGMREECPSALMKVIYTDTWSNYQTEYRAARKLISEGCRIISQHSDTEGPAAACEETGGGETVYHVGYNQSMSDIAPTTSLVSTGIDWTDYLEHAVEAVLSGTDIESALDAKTVGNDAQAGFDHGWVRMLPLNDLIAAPGTEEMIANSEQAFSAETAVVFKGNYRGTDPDDPEDVIDLKDGYAENENASAPSFHYILEGISIEQ